MATEEHRDEARKRLNWAGQVLFHKQDNEETVERLLADYALVGHTPIDVLKKRAQARVKGLK